MTVLSRRRPPPEACQNCHGSLPLGRSRWCSGACYTEARLDRISAERQAIRSATVHQCPDCSGAYLARGTRGPPPHRCPACRLREKRRSDQRRRALPR